MSDSPITRDTLTYLAGLARIKLDPAEEERLLGDLQRILTYVSQLQNADTSGTLPMNGGTSLTNVFRSDEERKNTHQGAGTEQFSEVQDGFLKVPAIFGEQKANGT